MNPDSCSDSESESLQSSEEAELARFRPLCCRGVVVNDGRQQAEHHVVNPMGDDSFYGRFRTMKLGKHSGRKKKKSIRVAAVVPRLTMSRFPGSTSFAAVGTTLCCVGGDAPDLFLFDYANYDELWRKGPPMLSSRVSPQVVALGRRLFVFGGCSPTSRRGSWAEVYDNSTNRWSYLPPLPSHLTPPVGRKRFFAVVVTVVVAGGDEESRQMIVVGGWGQTFCRFQLSTQMWSCLDFNPEIMTFFTPDSVAVGNTLYCFSRSECCFMAYDFDSQMVFGGALSGGGAQQYLDAWTPLCEGFRVLPHSDDDDDVGSVHLLFVWSRQALRSSSWDSPSQATGTYLHRARVRVSKVTISQSITSGYLDASVVSSFNLPIDDGFQLRDALLMDVVKGLQELSPKG